MIIGAGQQFPRNNSHCKLLIKNNSFNDQSSGGSAKTITQAGSIAWTSESSLPFTHSIVIDNSSKYVQVADNSDLDFGTLDFNIQCYIRYVSKTYAQNNIQKGWYISGKIGWDIGMDGTNGIRFGVSDGGTVYFVSGVPYGSINTNLFYHIYVKRESGIISIYVDGKYKNQMNCTLDISNDQPCYIGNHAHSSVRVANIMIHKGIALYTRNFTPPNRAS